MIMKKQKIVIIGICVFSFLTILSFPKLVFKQDDFGPYHHSARICQPTEICRIDNQSYCCINNEIYELNSDIFIKKNLFSR